MKSKQKKLSNTSFLRKIKTFIHALGKHQVLDLILILILAFLAWRDIPNLDLRGDSMIYFLKYYSDWFFGGYPFFASFEIMAVVVGRALSMAFGPWIPLYFWAS